MEETTLNETVQDDEETIAGKLRFKRTTTIAKGRTRKNTIVFTFYIILSIFLTIPMFNQWLQSKKQEKQDPDLFFQIFWFLFIWVFWLSIFSSFTTCSVRTIKEVDEIVIPMRVPKHTRESLETIQKRDTRLASMYESYEFDDEVFEVHASIDDDDNDEENHLIRTVQSEVSKTN
jgi:hypothetical protein